jgi:hypothetical protein
MASLPSPHFTPPISALMDGELNFPVVRRLGNSAREG